MFKPQCCQNWCKTQPFLSNFQGQFWTNISWGDNSGSIEGCECQMGDCFFFLRWGNPPVPCSPLPKNTKQKTKTKTKNPWTTRSFILIFLLTINYIAKKSNLHSCFWTFWQQIFQVKTCIYKAMGKSCLLCWVDQKHFAYFLKIKAHDFGQISTEKYKNMRKRKNNNKRKQ